jgi:hypothetical protein
MSAVRVRHRPPAFVSEAPRRLPAEAYFGEGGASRLLGLASQHLQMNPQKQIARRLAILQLR